MFERVEFHHFVATDSGEEEWLLSCEIEGRTNAGHVDLNYAQCGERVIDDEAAFLAYCEQHDSAIDLHDLAHRARERDS